MPRARAAHRLLLAASLVLLSIGVRPAHAAPGRFELVWSAPVECPDADDVKRRVERILNRPLMLAHNEVLSVKAEVRAPGDDRAWRVDLETDNGQRAATRALAAASCDELANATAILVAILLEPPSSSSTPVTAPSPTPPRPPRAEAHAAARSATRWSAGAAGGLIGGALPAWSPGAGVHGAVTWHALRTQLGAMIWLPAEKTVDPAGTQGAHFNLFSGHAQLCAQWPGQRLQPGLCSGAQLSVLRAKGFGPGVTPEARQATFVSISAGPALVWRHSQRLSFLVDAALLLPLGHRRFVLAGGAPAVVYSETPGVQLKCGAEFNL